jgi:hypothetical protein
MISQLKFLVSGTGRSGTVFMARYLTSLGLPCGHEAIFTPEGLAGAKSRLVGNKMIQSSHVATRDGHNIDPAKIVADSSYLSAPFLDSELVSSAKVIHVVRNPLKVISSTMIDANFFTDQSQKPYLNLVENYIPPLRTTKTKIEKAMVYYTLWNRLVIEKSKNKEYMRIRVERDVGKKLWDFLEITEEPKKVFENKKVNSWNVRQRDLTVEDLPDGQIKQEFIDISKEFGYNLKSPKML